MIEKKRYTQNPNACSVCNKEKLFAVKSKKICVTCNNKAKQEKAKQKRLEKKQKKATSHKTLVTQLDRIFSQYIRISHIGNDGLVKCYTCPNKMLYKQIQCGHFQSRRYMSTRYHEGNCRPQCYACNVGKSGEQFRFGLNLNEEFGEGHAESMERLAQEVKKFTPEELLELIQHYDKKLAAVKLEKDIW